jgi:hypothetical protein
MRKPAAAALAAVLAALGAAGATAGGRHGGLRHGLADAPAIAWGVADDSSKYADDGGAWFDQQLAGAGLTENRWTLAWNPATPDAIVEEPFLERAAPVAQAAGVHVVLALYAGTPAPLADAHDPTAFCAWAAKVAGLVGQWDIHDFIVWNEPNTRLYWTPQQGAPAAYEQLLATCYDTIHAADPEARVIGMGLSPRASTRASTEPLVFLRRVGEAYRESGRTAPIMDQLAVHPYPNPSRPTDSPAVGYQPANRFGIPNLDRVEQAVWDAFHGTGQPTTLDGLTLRIDEVGWQVDTTGLPQYVGAENVPVVTEAQQTSYLEEMVSTYFACDPAVTDVELFLLVDEPYRNGRDETGEVVGGGWQSGLLTAGGPGVSEPRPAYAALAPLFAAGRAACTGPVVDWRPNAGGSLVTAASLLGATTGLIEPDTAAGLQSALDRIQRAEHLLPSLRHGSRTRLAAVVGHALLQALAALGHVHRRAALDVQLLHTPRPLIRSQLTRLARSHSGVPARSSERHARSLGETVVAQANATVAQGEPARVPLRGLQASAGPGDYALVVTLRATAHPSRGLAFGLALRPVK